jgi:EAL domain-containing protein (putative c-di-GMP-specific phosphodiesterase class I)
MHGLVDRLRFLLDREDIDPRRLAVEVAETTATCRGAELAVAALGELRSLGLGVIVDHFGRDQAALANLARLGATAVKIDRGVVAQLGQSADSTTLLSGLATLAHSMKLQVVAKGVESRDQLSILEGIDCEGLQGVAVARPMPAESFAEWMVFNAPEANGSDMAADRETVADPRLSA